MPTEVKMWEDVPNNGRRIEIFISNGDMARAKFDEFDRLILEAPINSGADMLQTAELIVRRIEQS